jgi:hypothetical protein
VRRSMVVRFERLAIENGDRSITLELHRGLTVVTGLGRLEREGLVGEFVGALGSARPGVHLELAADNGHRFAIFRPADAPHRVIDVDRRADVTSQFTDADGAIDLLARAHLDARTARRAMRFGPRELAETTEHDRLVHQLARVDQREVWVAAQELRLADRRLEEEALAIGAGVEDAEVIERIEHRHAAFERMQERNETVRRATFLTAGVAALATVPLAGALGAASVAVLAVIAMAAVGVSIAYWRRLEGARDAEEEALADAGAHSYLGFHLQRVNGLLSSDLGRQRLIRAVEEQRDAAQRWSALAGTVDVEWAVSVRAEVAAAARIRADVAPFATPGDDGRHDDAATIAHAVSARLGELRQLGTGGESFPALLDDPFIHIDTGVLPALLEVLVRSSEHQQIVLLTDSEAITDWARVEAMTGTIGVAEPVPTERPLTL